jgi:hypothetical protein
LCKKKSDCSHGSRPIQIHSERLNLTTATAKIYVDILTKRNIAQQPGNLFRLLLNKELKKRIDLCFGKTAALAECNRRVNQISYSISPDHVKRPQLKYREAPTPRNHKGIPTLNTGAASIDTRTPSGHKINIHCLHHTCDHWSTTATINYLFAQLPLGIKRWVVTPDAAPGSATCLLQPRTSPPPCEVNLV